MLHVNYMEMEYCKFIEWLMLDSDAGLRKKLKWSVYRPYSCKKFIEWSTLDSDGSLKKYLIKWSVYIPYSCKKLGMPYLVVPVQFVPTFFLKKKKFS